MRSSRAEIPKPGNPYQIHLILVSLLWLAGILAASATGGPSRANPYPFVIGVMLLTLAFVLSIGIGYGWFGFEKRFGARHIIAYWVIDEFDWDGFVSSRRRELISGGLAATAVFPTLASGTLLLLAWSDGKTVETLPVVAIVWLAMAGIFWAVIGTRLCGLGGKSGRVWLADRGVLMNGTVFFSDSYGVTVLECRSENEGMKPEFVIRYRMESGRTAGEHELRIPVPEDQLEVAAGTVAGWVGGGR